LPCGYCHAGDRLKWPTLLLLQTWSTLLCELTAKEL
jgi:hypothetical protein